MIECLIALQFGAGGNAENHLGPGWSDAEPGFRWMTGAESDIWLENPGAAGDAILELDLKPFVAPPGLPAQRLRVLVRGVEIGHGVLVEGVSLAWLVPEVLLQGDGPVRITLQHPDARRPNELSDSPDDRPLAISVQSARLLQVPRGAVPAAPAWTSWAAGLPVGAGHNGLPMEMSAAELVMQFESIGDNCEFGLVQRLCGKEPLGLLRFANIRLRALLRGMRSGFAGLGAIDSLRLLDEADAEEYVVRDVGYGITYHTFLYKDQVTESGLLARQSARLKFLARKLLDDVGSAEKILVFKRNEALSQQEVLPLYIAIRARGDSTLLWVTPADETHAPGQVEQVLPGLLRGWIDSFAPYENAHELSFDTWLKLCCRAYNLGSGSNVRCVMLPGRPAPADPSEPADHRSAAGPD